MDSIVTLKEEHKNWRLFLVATLSLYSQQAFSLITVVQHVANVASRTQRKGPAVPVVTNLIGPTECDSQRVCASPWQMLPTGSFHMEDL